MIPTVLAYTTLCLLLGVFSSVNGLNDWTKPCFDGECAYDLPESSGVSAIYKLFGSPKSITDITPAAGWAVLDCDPNRMEQDIRLVCGADHESSGCEHVFSHGGPTNKIVRLPESCGNGPFARIVSMSVSDDQSLPAHAHDKIQRRDGPAPQVHAMTIDLNFALIDGTQSGDVKFAMIGATVPGLDLNAAFTDNIFDDIGAWISNAVQTVGKAITDAAEWIGGKLQDLGNWLKDKTTVQIKPQVEFDNISLNADISVTKDDNTLASTLLCPDSFTNFEANINSKGWLIVKAGIVVIGHILPYPWIDQFAAFGGVNGEVDARLQFNVSWQGGFVFEKNVVSDIGLPGFSIPGYLIIMPRDMQSSRNTHPSLPARLITIGPAVTMKGKIQGHLEIDLYTEAHLSYVFDNLELWYPKEFGERTKRKGISTRSSTFNLQASAQLSARALLRGTISPEVHFGLRVLEGTLAKGTIYVGADAYLQAVVQADANAKARIKLGPKREIAGDDTESNEDNNADVAEYAAVNPSSRKGRTSSTRLRKAGAKASVSAGSRSKKAGGGGSTRSRKAAVGGSTRSAKAAVGGGTSGDKPDGGSSISAEWGFSGCFWLELGLRLKAGAEGSLLHWEAQAEFTIWQSPNWEIFSKCWALGNAVADKSKKPTWTFEELDNAASSYKCSSQVATRLMSHVISEILAPKQLD